MKRVTVVQLRRNLAAWLEQAHGGERFVIHRRNEPIAALGPSSEGDEQPGLAAPVAAEPGLEAAWPSAHRAASTRHLPTSTRLAVFDAATARQADRERATPRDAAATRGWNREELYDRDRPR